MKRTPPRNKDRQKIFFSWNRFFYLKYAFYKQTQTKRKHCCMSTSPQRACTDDELVVLLVTLPEVTLSNNCDKKSCKQQKMTNWNWAFNSLPFYLIFIRFYF